MTVAQPPIKYSTDELLRFQSEPGVEFVNGMIVEKPVSIESSEVELAIGALLRNAALKTHEARAFPASMGYQCFREDPSRYRKPDASVVRFERLKGFDPETGLIPFPPDLAVEVISPNDVAGDINEKVEEYLANGFPLIWVVYPKTRSVTIYRGDGSVSVLHEQDEITGEAALPSFRCKVAEFFLK